MRLLILCLTASLFTVTAVGCSSEKVPEQVTEQKTMALSSIEQEKIRLFMKELNTVTELPDKTFSLVAQELMVLVAGNWDVTRLNGLMATAGKEVADMTRRLAAIAVPDGISPEIKQQLQKLKDGVVTAGQLKGESLAVITRALEEKKPMILLEYRKKMAEVGKQLDEVRQNMKKLQTDTGITI